MNLNQIGGGHFSAIAASFNPTLKRDCAKAAQPLSSTLGRHMPIEPQIDTMKPSTETYLSLVEAFRRDDIKYKEIANLLAQDDVLVSLLYKIVARTSFLRSLKVESLTLDQIVMLFGVRRIAEEIRKSETQSGAEGWKHIIAPLQPLPNSTFQRTRFAHR